MNLSVIREEYPFASHYFDLNGFKYHYLDEGTGPVVVMLHGNPTWSFFYRNLVLALRDTHRVIVPDHMGCGLSDKPQRYAYRLETHVRNFECLAEHLGLSRLDLVVHDWGGPIGLGYGVKYPERIRRLVVLNTTAFVTHRYPLGILACKVPVVGALAVRGLNLFAGAAVRLAVTRRLSAPVRAGYLLPYDSFAHRIANLRFVQDIPLGPRHPSWKVAHRIEERLDCLRATPKLICWGGADPCFDAHFLRQWQCRFPDATVQLHPDAGHYVLEDAGAEIIPAVRDFLAVSQTGNVGEGA